MSISFNPNERIHSVQTFQHSFETKHAANSAQTTDAAKTSTYYDKVSISNKETIPDDKSFAAILAKKTAAAVKQGVSSDKVAEIRQKVQTGEYHVDSTRIAEHMLGYKK
uniref:flagellar biosynthesis anti-sigma factor FlgM n=1 Tax=Eubacterium cellulosolvens TaxID=29322 RepID=UPI0004835F7B|nr:flagellar biosynthesis anti-sigma factor FlgM [[Eubacterium] cellulosolvens]